jgi:NAD(P)H-flavin reductase
MTFTVVSVEKRRSIAAVRLSVDIMPELSAGDLVEIQGSLFSIVDYVADTFMRSVDLLVSPKGRASRELYGSFRGRMFEGTFVSSAGRFEPCEPNSLCIATGTGVAPFLFARSLGYVSSLLWGIRYIEDYPHCLDMPKCCICFSQMQDQSSSGYPIQASQFLGRVQQYLITYLHASELPLTKKPYYAHIYVCGHSEMIKDVTEILIDEGYPRDRIESEVFFT